MFRIEEIIRECGAQIVSGPDKGGVSGVCIDSRKIRKGNIFLAIKGERYDGHDFAREVAAKSPGMMVLERLPFGFKAQKNTCVLKVGSTVEALGKIASLHRRSFNIPVIAITGTAGKTTTKEMLSHVLSAKFRVLKNEGTQNNHIGVPLTMLKLNKRHSAAVIELGTNHFGEINNLARMLRPDIGIITNIGAGHLEFFKDLSGVLKEKRRILDNLSSSGIAVLNSDDRMLGRIKTGHPVFTFGMDSPADTRAWGLSCSNNKLAFRVNSGYNIELKVPGRNNVHNALCSILVSRILGVGYGDIRARLKSYTPLPGRMKVIRRKDCILLDDSYNSNPLSLRSALSVLSGFNTGGRRILVMGDMLELGARSRDLHLGACPQIRECCDVFIAVGKFSRLSAEELKKSGFRKEYIFSCDSSYQARSLLYKRVRPGNKDVVLIKGSRRMRLEEVIRP